MEAVHAQYGKLGERGAPDRPASVGGVGWTGQADNRFVCVHTFVTMPGGMLRPPRDRRSVAGAMTDQAIALENERFGRHFVSRVKAGLTNMGIIADVALTVHRLQDDGTWLVD